MTTSCEMTLLVQADFDGELDAKEAAAVEAHRAGCPLCQAAYADLRRVREALRAGDLRHPASERLRRSLTERVRGADRTAPRRWSSWGVGSAGFGLGAAVAAAIMLTVAALNQAALVDDMVADHVRSLQPGHLMDVASTDRHTVKPWFDGKLDFAPPVKDLADQGFPLQGGRLDYAHGRPIAALVYGRAKHTISFFVWPEGDAGPAPENESAHNGYNVVHLNRDGMTIWIVSDVEKRELQEFVRLWQSAP